MSQNGLDYYGRTPKLQAVIDSLELFSGTYGVSSPSHWTPLNHGRTLPHGSGVQGKQEAAGRMRQQIIDAQGTRQSHERRHLEPVPVPAQAWPDAKGLDAVLKLLSLRPHLRSAEHVDEILPCLQRLSTVRGLPEVAQRALCAFAGAVEVQQGEYLYRRGDKADTVYVVLKGSVHLIVPAHHSINVHEVEMAVMQAGSGFGDSVFTLSQHAPGQRNTDAVVQASACTLLRLHVKDYDMTISALQAEELLNSLQTPAHLRSDSHISLVTRVVCNQVDFFNKFSEEKRSKFARVLTVIKADQKRSVLYSRQTPADAAYICLSCTVDLYSRALRRKATVISRANSGSIARALSSEKLNQFGEKKAPMLESASKSQVFSEPTSDEARLTALLQGNRLSKRASHEIDSPPVSRTASTESVGAYLPSLPESPITQAGAHSSDSLAAEHQPGAVGRFGNMPLSRTSSSSSRAPVLRKHVGEIFGEVEMTEGGPHGGGMYTTDARVYEPGWLVVLRQADYQRIVYGFSCVEMDRKLEDCVRHAFCLHRHHSSKNHHQSHHHKPEMSVVHGNHTLGRTDLSGLGSHGHLHQTKALDMIQPASSAQGPVEHEALKEMRLKLQACFRHECIDAGHNIALQGNKVEDLIMILSGDVKVSVMLLSQKVPPTEQSSDTSPSSIRSVKDRVTMRDHIPVVSLGQFALLGFGDCVFRRGVWTATYEADTETHVFRAPAVKVMAILDTKDHRKLFQFLSDSTKEMFEAWGKQLQENYYVLQQSRKKQGHGLYHPCPSSKAQMKSFSLLHTASVEAGRAGPGAGNARLGTASSGVLTGSDEPGSPAFPDEEHPPSARAREDAELMSDFKAKLLADEKSVVARITRAREKRTAGPKPLVPQLAINHAIPTRGRMEVLATSRSAKLPVVSKEPSPRCTWGGIPMSKGAWLTERAARNTTWLRPHLGEKFSESSSVRANLLLGKFAEQAARRIDDAKLTPQRAVATQVSELALSCFRSLDEQVQCFALGQDEVRALVLDGVLRQAPSGLKHNGVGFLARSIKRPVSRAFMLPVGRHLVHGALDSTLKL